MPYIEIGLYGRTVTDDEKQRLFSGCLDVLQQTLGSRPSSVRVAIHSWPADSFFDGATVEAESGSKAPAEGAGR